MRVQTTGSLRLLLGLGIALTCAPSCGGGGGASSSGSLSRFSIVEVSNGFGKLLPYQIAVKNALGQPTNQFVEITSLDRLLDNVTSDNPVRPPTEWPQDATLPNSLPGNHFILVRFSQQIDPTTVLAQSSSSEPGRIGTGIQIQTVNPISGVVTPLLGRAFVGGKTFGPALNPSDPSKYRLETWVQATTGGLAAADVDGDTPGLGFPGTEPGTGFAGDAELVDDASFVFVADSDDDLTTPEAFPLGQIQIRITEAVGSARGKKLDQVGFASSTVGPDVYAPEVALDAAGDPVVTPRKGAIDVDPQTNIVLEFTEPVRITDVGDLDDGTPPALSASVQLVFGPSSSRVTVPFTVRPLSIYDLSRFELRPVYDFPGVGPTLPDVNCDTIFGNVDVVVNRQQVRDLSAAQNQNSQNPTSFFTTREGPGLVNAPVTPDAVYIGRTGSFQGISVIDLNGFGQGTGNPTYDIQKPIKKGNTNFPNNPNLKISGPILIPPLSAGSCTFNGGSEGPFTLTKDSSLRDLVAASPQIESVGDMALGHALDNTFNNESPFGCQAGGGNICAQSGLKTIAIISGGPNTVASANIATVAPIKTDQGVENLVSWAPHPNPPPLVFPPLCLSPLINAVEPTSIVSTLPPLNLRNLLVPGPNPLGIPAANLPPQSALTSEQNSFFEGPSAPQPNITACTTFMMRQQVGQFLYVVDRVASEIVVFNSNRFTVLDRIRLLDPTSLAISPNLDFLAVTNQDADQVAFIDIDPASATFHQVIKTTRVGTGPTGIAWESGNEDIFVCNEGEGTVSILSGFTLEVRKTLRNQISRPIDVALTPRQTTIPAFGFSRLVYFAYILNQNGKVAVFESGPDGVNGWGVDNVFTSLPFTFARPKTLQADLRNLNSAVWIAHQDPLDENGQPTNRPNLGALSSVGITGGQLGVIPLDPGPFGNPALRELTFSVLASIGEGDGLSGIPVDIAFDNMRNLSALTNAATFFSPGTPLSYNGKSMVRYQGNGTLPSNSPLFMFAAVPNPGVVDVFDMASGSFSRVDTDPFTDGTQSILAPNATVLMDYFRQ